VSEPGTVARARRGIGPEISGFSRHLHLLVLMWPAWWLLGVDQFIVPLFAVLELVRLLASRQGRIALNMPCLMALLLAAWWVVPVPWLEPGHLQVFVKELATAWSQVFLLVVITNEVRSPEDRQALIRSLLVLAAWVAAGAVVYASGLWRGEVTTLLGKLLPAGLREGSEFLSSISTRSLGTAVDWQDASRRLSSLALNFSGLSMLALLLIPLAAWRLVRSRGWHRLAAGSVLGGLLLGLVESHSRTARLAFLAGIGFAAACLASRYMSRALRWGLAGALCALALVAVAVNIDPILYAVESRFIDERSDSFWVRSQVYRETLLYLGEHPIAGWGQPVEIPGLRRVFSAGTHSSYLGMLFQHGVVGLLLYLGLLATIWRRVLRGLRSSPRSRPELGLWLALACTLLSFNLREAADSWWWDQLVVLTVWCVWGLVISLDREPRESST
jgi:O-antigen ligase